jgi:hypothetical protein
MIRRDELRKASDAKRLTLENAERDYVLEVLLYQIYSEFPDELVFKGGTALYKTMSLNRFSEDLDFTLDTRRFDADRFIGKVLRGAGLLGLAGKPRDVEVRSNEINARLEFRGPLFSGGRESLSRVTLNISRRERVRLAPERVLIVPVYREMPAFTVRVMDGREMLSEKVRAVLTRQKPRDIYDIWFLLNRGLRPERDLIDAKLKPYRKSFSKEAFLAALEEKRGAWRTDLHGLVIGELVDFETAVDRIRAAFFGPGRPDRPANPPRSR